MKTKLFQIALMFLTSINLLAQEFNVIPYLKMVESGKIEEVNQKLPELKATHPNDPSVMFLDAVLTGSGEQALTKYQKIVNEFPESRFADAAQFRVFSYYFALGLYKQAENNLRVLQAKFPNSPYIKFAEQNLDYRGSAQKQNVEAKPAPPRETLTNNEKAIQANFTVQAGAFLNVDNARNLKAQIEAAGYAVEIIPKSVGASILNAVMIGKFETEREAENREGRNFKQI